MNFLKRGFYYSIKIYKEGDIVLLLNILRLIEYAKRTSNNIR